MVEYRVPEFRVPFFSAMYDSSVGRFFDPIQRHTHESIIKKLEQNQLVIFDLTRDQYHGNLRFQTVADIKQSLDKQKFDNIVYLTSEIDYIDHEQDRIVFCPLWFFSKHIDYKSVLYKIKKLRNYNISCLNRFPFSHKVYTFYQLLKNNLITDKSLVSCNGLKDPYNLQRQMTMMDLWDIPTKIKDELASINLYRECMPLDNKWNNDHSITHPAFSDTYLNIITESTYCTSFYTEKTCKPLASGQLFLSANGPSSLKTLRHYGFDCFDNVFSAHDYEEDLNFITRIDKMINVLINLYPNIEQIYHDSLDRIMYNREYFLSEKFKNCVLQPLISKELI